MNTTSTSQRIIASTWQRADLDDSVYTRDDYADLLQAEIDKAGHYAHRESCTVEYGQKVTHAFVAEYTDPATGQTRYAHYYGDQTGTEYTDYATLAEAVAEYEQNVRALEECGSGAYNKDGEPQRWFEQSDVEI